MNRTTLNVSLGQSPKEETWNTWPLTVLLMCLAAFVMLTGCATQVYRPSKTNVPPLSVEEAAAKLKTLVGVEIAAVEYGSLANSMHRGPITNVEVRANGTEITFEERRLVLGNSAHRSMVPFSSMDSVSSPGGGYWYVDFRGGQRLFPRTKEQAISIAQAFYVLGNSIPTSQVRNHTSTDTSSPAAPAEGGVFVGTVLRYRMVKGWGFSHVDMGITIQANDGSEQEFFGRDSSVFISANGETTQLKRTPNGQFVHKRVEVRYAIIEDATGGLERFENGKNGIISMRPLE